MLKSLKKNFFLKLTTFAFMIVVSGFNTSGLMPVFGIAMLVVALLYGPTKIVLNFKAIPLELKLLNIWVVWALITGLLVSSNIEFFFAHFSTTATLILALNVVYLIMVYDPSIIKAFAVALIITGIIQFLAINLGWQNAEHIGKEREYGLEGNPNSLGLKMVYATFGLFFLFGHKVKKIIPLIFIATLSVVFFQIILLSGSRKSVISFGVLVVTLIAITLVNSQKNISFGKLLIYLLPVTIAGVLIAPTLLEGSIVAERFNALEEGGGIEGDIRYTMYQFGLELFYDNPIAGVGLNNYKEFFYTGQYSHSDYVETLASTGLVGFVIYQSAFLVLIFKSLKGFLKKGIDKGSRFNLGLSFSGVVLLKIIAFGIILYTSPSAMLIFISLVFIGNNTFKEILIRK